MGGGVSPHPIFLGGAGLVTFGDPRPPLALQMLLQELSTQKLWSTSCHLPCSQVVEQKAAERESHTSLLLVVRPCTPIVSGRSSCKIWRSSARAFETFRS